MSPLIPSERVTFNGLHILRACIRVSILWQAHVCGAWFYACHRYHARSTVPPKE